MAQGEARVDANVSSRLVAFALVTVAGAAVLSVLGVTPGLVLAWLLLAAAVVAVVERELLALLGEALLARERRAAKKITIEKPSVPAAVPASAPPEDAGATLPVEVQALAPAPVEARSEGAASQSLFGDLRKTSSKEKDEPKRELNHAARLALELGLPILLMVGTLVVSGRLAPKAVDGGKGDGGCCCVCTTAPKQGGDHGNDNSGGGDFDGSHGDSSSVMRLSPELEAAVLRYLDGREQAPSSSGWNIWLLLAIAAGVVFLAFAVKEHPATTAPLAAAGLALAAMKSDHVSHFDRVASWVFLGAFVLVAGVLVWFALYRWKRLMPHDGEADEGRSKRKSKLVESPLNVVLSMAILLWTGLVLCYHQRMPRPENKPTDGPVQPQPPVDHPLEGKVEYKLLTPIPGFAPFHSEIPAAKEDAVEKLAAELGSPQSARLLLLGSADCTAIRKGRELTNKQLAEQRALVVKDALQRRGVPKGVAVDAVSLHQYDRCRESEDLRAVFPVLLLGR
ncbi:MAG: hypothetical protein PW789_08755 [Edaphobacter sp.]|uniref:hypothetical protein n=1 Tax=Edaphobacter sp. TaxID=1934404 RepID=UPI002384E541|nr:hypothetical protein [Edaphobacter sp.]MDE1176685.1 hypothetical protein [Edaphobacter sp.]